MATIKVAISKRPIILFSVEAAHAYMMHRFRVWCTKPLRNRFLCETAHTKAVQLVVGKAARAKAEKQIQGGQTDDQPDQQPTDERQSG